MVKLPNQSMKNVELADAADLESNSPRSRGSHK
jgi:hypothetical protein